MNYLALALLVLSPAMLPAQELDWHQFPNLPDREGFAGMYAGVSQDALLAAGGANFPGHKPWEGGTKAWYDTVYVLEKPGGEWRAVGKLPTGRGYGVSVAANDGVLCIGGADSDRHYADCFLLCWEAQHLKIKPMPTLPRPMANFSGARVGDIVYVAGGIETPTATETLKNFLALDLKHLDQGWKELPTWPGRARMLAVAAVSHDHFFLISGTDLSADADGKPLRTYLADGFSYSPAEGWARIKDLPQATVAAPSPAPSLARGFAVLGGDDGALVNFEPKANHPGFPKVAWGYDFETNTWTALGEMPVSHVTNPTAVWGDKTVIVSGEARPGVRSPEVWCVGRKKSDP